MSDNDIRRIPIRLIGYSLAFSEALKFSYSNIKLLSFCRGITIGYALFDVIHKTKEARKQSSKIAALTATDVFLWQASASIILPTIAVNQLCWIVRTLMQNIRAPTANILTSTIGISVLPICVEPFDYLTNYVLNETFRKYVQEL